MKTPKYIEFHNETNRALSRILKETEPEEGCCILIGNKNISATSHKRNIWEVIYIWPCRNVWGEKESKLIDQKMSNSANQENVHLSKINRFEIDAKDLIASQKWARNNNLEILCFAHSHPSSENKPSEMDLSLHHSPGLMIISDKYGNLKAWWVKNKLNFHSVKIEIFL